MGLQKILYVNDYGCSYVFLDKINNGKEPKHHIWGVDYLIQKGWDVRLGNYPKMKYTKFKILNYLIKIFSQLIFFIGHFRYSTIYAAQTGLIDFFALAKKMGIKKYKLIVVVHHDQAHILLKKMYNRIFFISINVYENYCMKFPKLQESFVYSFWGADQGFYDKNKCNTPPYTHHTYF